MNRPLTQFTKFVFVITSIALLTTACGDSGYTTNVGAAPGNNNGTPATTAAPTTTSSPAVDPALPLGAGPYPIADITVTVHPDGVDSTPNVSYRLSCLGDTATMTGDAVGSAASMCLTLSRPDVYHLLLNLPPTDQMCTEIYGGPNVATFNGTLNGEQVNFKANRVNGCAINDWDSTLIDLLR